MLNDGYLKPGDAPRFHLAPQKAFHVVRLSVGVGVTSIVPLGPAASRPTARLRGIDVLPSCRFASLGGSWGRAGVAIWLSGASAAGPVRRPRPSPVADRARRGPPL